MLRWIRAFVIALKLTLRGEVPPVSPYQPLFDWIETGAKLAGQVINKAQTNAELWQMTLKIEGREQSVATTLRAIHYHFDTEYPYMMEHFTRQTITAIYGTNMNDQFALGKLLDAAASHNPQLIQQLADHLDNIPPSNNLPQPE